MEQPSHGLLQDAGSQPSTGRFRPYASTKHRVTRGRYITSNDRRGYIPVYEYPLNGQWIMMDIDDGYILWTGIWKALGNAKADIVKMLESQPDLAPQLRRVRGGYLKIQGTWMPYEVALRLARRVAWTIREDLIPLFGPTFPATCLTPDQPGYGQILGSQQGKRRGRRAAVPLPLSATLPPPHASDSDTSPGDRGQQTRQPGPSPLPPLSAVTIEERHPHLLSPSQFAGPSGTRRDEFRDAGRYSGESSSVARYTYTGMRSQLSGHTAPAYSPSSMASVPVHKPNLHHVSEGNHRFMSSSGPVREAATDIAMHSTRDRFSPYQGAAYSRHRSGVLSGSAISRPSPIDLPPLTIPSSQPRSGSIVGNGVQSVDLALTHGGSALRTSVPERNAGLGELITLPPINMDVLDDMPSDISRRRSQGGSGYTLPPISALSTLPPPSASGNSSYRFNSAAVLRRLALDDKEIGESRRASFVSMGDEERSHRDTGDDISGTIDVPTQEQLSRRRRSLSEPLLQPDLFSHPHPTGLTGPDMSPNPSSEVSSRPSYPVSNPQTESAQPESQFWTSSTPSTQSGPAFRQEYNPLPSHLREDSARDTTVTSDVSGLSPASPSRRERLNEVYYTDAIDRSRKQYSTVGGHHAEHQSTFPMPNEHSRPHEHSRTSTPLGYRACPQAPSTYTHPVPETTVEFSSYRFGVGSPYSREDALSPTYAGGQRSRDDRVPASGFHSSSPSG